MSVHRIFALIFLLQASPILLGKSKFKLDAYMVSELEAESAKNGEAKHQGKIEISSKRKNGLKAEFGVRFRSTENDVSIREAIINKKLDDDWKLEFGYGKKRFGLEYDVSKVDRPTVDRSPLYRRLEIFTYAGRETLLRYYKKMNLEKEETGYSLTFTHSEAQNTSFIGSIQKPFNANWSFNYWLQLQSDHLDDGQQLVWAAMHSFERRTQNNLFQFELLAGIDPEETELRKTIGDNERVKFVGLKLHYNGTYHFVDDVDWIQWVLETGGMIHDVDEPEYNSVHALAGLNYGFEPIKLAFNLELIGSSNRLDVSNRSFSESSAKIELLYEF